MRGRWGKWVAVGLLAVAMFAGCQGGRRGASVSPPGNIIEAGVFSHRGDRAIIIRAARDTNENGCPASMLDFAAKKEISLSPGNFGGEPAWSPDDRHIALSLVKDSGMLIGLLDSKDLSWRPIAIGSQSSFKFINLPIWSADGRQLVFDAFSSSSFEGSTIFLYDVSTQECYPQEVGGLGKCVYPFWQGRILCARQSNPSGSKYLSYRSYSFLPRPGKRRATKEILPYQSIVRVSASATSPWLAVICREDTVNHDKSVVPKYAVYLVSGPDDTAGRKLCSDKFKVIYRTPQWSSKGDDLLMAINNNTADKRQGQLAIISAKDGAITRLTDRKGNPVCGMSPQWADNDKAICYSFKNAGGIGLWRYDRASRKTTRLFPFAKQK
jgi:Tol biopolymer transport system component